MTDIQNLLYRQNQNGGQFWSRSDGDIHAPNGYGTIDTLHVLGELGATTTKYKTISKAIVFVLSYQSQDGCFRYSKKSSKLPCMTARILSAIGRLKFEIDERIEKSYQQLLQTQRDDGGWRCNTVKLGTSATTDASNPGTTLYVLDAFRFRRKLAKETKQLENGVLFLLQHWSSKKPTGPCSFGMGSRFMKIEYPFLRYNLFYFVYILSFFDIALKDRRFQEAFDVLHSKIKDHTLRPENPHKAWREFDFGKKGEASKLGTERWIEIKKNIKNTRSQ